MSRHDEHCEIQKSTWSALVITCFCANRAAAEADLRRVRNELRDRLNTLDDATKLVALAELAHTHPDKVNNALNEIGASDV